jgi:hypothetical protein
MPDSTKPTVADLGVDPAAQRWQRSGSGDGSIEVAFIAGRADADADADADAGNADGGDAEAEWVLLRVAGDPDERILVFDRNEWDCFLDGARNGEFDDAVS